MAPLVSPDLTDREREVLDLYRQGMSQRTLATRFGVSRSSIRDTIERAERKLARVAYTRPVQPAK